MKTASLPSNLISAALVTGLGLALSAGCAGDGESDRSPATTAFPPADDSGDGSTGEDPEPETSTGEVEDDESTGVVQDPADHDALDAFILGLGHLNIDEVATKHQVACNHLDLLV